MPVKRSSGQRWGIRSMERDPVLRCYAWYQRRHPGKAHTYTPDIADVGLFTEEEAMEISMERCPPRVEVFSPDQMLELVKEEIRRNDRRGLLLLSLKDELREVPK